MSTTLSRRAVLRALAGGVGALWTSDAAGSGLTPRTSAPARVIVIGAGLAGLAAAYELQRAGHDVIVLEARDVPGGRVRTLRDGFADGLYAEGGGQAFFPVADDHAARYADAFGLKRLPQGPEGLADLWHFRGRTARAEAGALDWPLELTAAERELGLAGMRRTYLAPAADELASLVDPSERRWPAAAVERFDTLSFRQLLATRGASEAAIELLRIADFDYVGEGAGAYSAIDMLGQLYNARAAARYARGTFFSIDGGNDRLPRAFADRLGDRLRLGAAVTRIQRSDAAVTVEYTRSGRDESTSADYAVCTIPFPVLRAIPVTPPFSPGKATAIRELAYASVARTYVQCRRRVWVEQGLSGFASTDLPTTYFWDSSAGQPGTRGILHGYVMGPHARAFAARDAAGRRAFALDQIGRVFPAAAAQAESVMSIAWDEERWSRGAYAYLRPGDARRLFPHLASPEGRVHFAGEHTSTWFLHGSMQGALQSGIRAAGEIHERAHRR